MTITNPASAQLDQAGSAEQTHSPHPALAARARTLSTPDGPFSIIACAQGVLASGWTTDLDALTALIHPSLRAGVESDAAEDAGASSLADSAEKILDTAEAAVKNYYDGDHPAPGAVPVLQTSGPYRQSAWEVLREVPAGAPISYAEYAGRTSNPQAVRAAASACAFNAAALFVPCHRVVRTDGSLGGFRYGLELKRSLLEREAS